VATCAAQANGSGQRGREQQSVRWPPKDGQPTQDVDRWQRIELSTVSDWTTRTAFSESALTFDVSGTQRRRRW